MGTEKIYQRYKKSTFTLKCNHNQLMVYYYIVEIKNHC